MQAGLAALEAELPHSKNVAATFTRFIGSCFKDRADAGRASACMIRLFSNDHPELRAHVRLVDVERELALGSKLLALHMLHYWDTARDDHRITLLAETLLCSAEDAAQGAPPAILVDVAEALALRRPDLAERLVAQAIAAGVSEGVIERCQPRLAAGRFLQTQTEGVRHFWQHHLRLTATRPAVATMAMKAGIEAVRAAPLPDHVFDVFRASLTDELWEGNVSAPSADSETAAATPPVPARISPAGLLAKLAASQQKPGRSIMQRPGIIAAGITALAGACVLIAFTRHAETSAALPATAVATISRPAILTTQTAGAAEKPKPALERPSAVVPSRKVPVIASRQPGKEAPLAPASSPVKLVGGSSPTAASATTAQSVPASAAPDLTLERGWSLPAEPVIELAATRRDALAAKPTAAPLSASASIPSALVEVPQEIVARPLDITDHDRWLMAEIEFMARENPGLISLQQSIGLAPWRDGQKQLAALRAKPGMEASVRTLLRWLVLDPPMQSAARSGVLEEWAQLADPDECVLLWSKLLRARVPHAQDIRSAAWRVLVQPSPRWTAEHRDKLRHLAADTGSP